MITVESAVGDGDIYLQWVRPLPRLRIGRQRLHILHAHDQAPLPGTSDHSIVEHLDVVQRTPPRLGAKEYVECDRM